MDEKGMPEVLREKRLALGLSQEQLGKEVGTVGRQIRRYEDNESDVTLRKAKRIADRLGISLDELAGNPQRRADLAGEWWAGWQTTENDKQVLAIQPVHFKSRGEDIEIKSLEPSGAPTHGGYMWRGLLHIWDNEILTGWYTADDKANRSIGTLYLSIHRHGHELTGRWVGASHDGPTRTGHAAIARGSNLALALLKKLCANAE